MRAIAIKNSLLFAESRHNSEGNTVLAMRRILVILACSLAAVPAAFAGSRATGDGVLELKAVYGKVTIGKPVQPARGLLWGQMDSGKLIVEDPVPGDGKILVTGYENKSFTPASIIDGTPAQTTYSGTNIHFRVTGGKYRLVFRGSGIDLTAIGAGTAILNASESALDPGYFAVDAGDWTPAPLFAVKSVPFGTTTAPAATP
jgi:hypothetical protein